MLNFIKILVNPCWLIETPTIYWAIGDFKIRGEYNGTCQRSQAVNY